MSGNLSVPLRLVQEAEGHLVQIELDDGSTMRGYLIACEDNMNCKLKDVVATAPSGARTVLKETFVRGSLIKFFCLPAVLEQAPILNPSVCVAPDARGGGKGFRPDAGSRPKDMVRS